ncbi:ABC transporter substrate-binding protein [Chakrabartyella piscis]|uniref:ABC transporter substrate-binding protein n=1 Tax=Chakrabartyella piscis TaxID=2918914 RepID=UPI002958C500|nr:ABC transporter substrate-binding protein [Chakrabartyella piscis]
MVPMALAATMMFSAVGCGSSEAAAPAATTAEATEVVEEVSYKGAVTLYTSQPEADAQALIAAFNELYPDVTVNVFRSGTEEVVSKILAEKQVNSVQADIVLVSDDATFETLKAEDLLMSYASPELDGIDPTYYDVDNTYTGTKIVSTGIMVNTDVINLDEVEITCLADLTKPELANEVIMPSPLYSGAAAYNLGVLLRTDGFGWDYFNALKDNGITVGQGNGTVQTAVLSGEKGAGIIIEYMAIREQLKGAPVEFIYPTEGSLSVTEPIAIVNGTQNEELAKLFVDFILSDFGQEVTAEIGYTPIRQGVAAPEGFKTADELENLTYDTATLVETREADKEEFAKIFG